MSKSKDFIISRIKDGYCSNDFIAEEFEEAICFHPWEVLNDKYKDMIKNDALEVAMHAKDINGNLGTTNIKIKYDPDAEFEYFSSDICTHDGTLLFLAEGMINILNRLLGLGTYNISKAPSDWQNHVWDYDYEYVIGDFVINTQIDDKFAPTDKPWMTAKQIVTLPIAWRYIEKEE